MTTERREPSRDPRLRASPLELRLYVAALLAVVYTISWRAIGGPAAGTEPPSIATLPTPTEPPRFVWIDRLPASLRPVVVLPAGWQLASESPPPPTTERAVRVPDRRVPRVRTRSS